MPRLQYDVDMSTLPERMSMLNEAKLLIEDVDKYNRLESRHLLSISRCNHFFHDLLRNELLSHKGN